MASTVGGGIGAIMPGFLALDVGDRRIGVAVSEWADLVTPLGVIPRGSGDIETILRHVEERFIDRIVVGLPLSLDDSVGTQAKKVLGFVERLKAATSVPVELYDERFTTHAAEEKLIDLDASRARRKKTVDAMAAAEILRGYLSDRAEREARARREDDAAEDAESE